MVWHLVDQVGAEMVFGWNNLVDDPRLKTGDGVIPRDLFVLLAEDLVHLRAHRRLEETRAHHLGAALAWGGDDGKLRRRVRDLEDAALPTVKKGD